MLKEVMDNLSIQKGDTVVDGTMGEGGHALEIAKAIKPSGLLVGIDKDKDNIIVARNRIASITVKFKFFRDSYVNIKNNLRNINIKKVDGILLDLGFSSRHIKVSKRGFSFLEDEKIDMRYDVTSGEPAFEWINTAEKKELEKVIKDYGEEKEYRRIVYGIMKHREKEKIMTTKQLVNIIARSKKIYPKKIHFATKTFQAIRIHINNELDDISEGLHNAIKVLAAGKRLVVLTYHSIEDRIVKDIMQYYQGRCSCPPNFPICVCDAASRSKIRIVKGTPVKASAAEIKSNPSARSAKLRVCEII